MTAPQPQMLELVDSFGKRKLAWLRSEADEAGAEMPGVLWLPGFNSVMTSSKATALAEWAARDGRELTRFDYSAHGASPGRFEDGTIGQWLADATAAFEQLTVGPQIVVGSSMGGYIALLMARSLPKREAKRLKGLVLLAPAWNLTERLITPQGREIALRTGVWRRPSEFGGEDTITRKFIEDGDKRLININFLPLNCPLRVLHGVKDTIVPFAGSADLVRRQGKADARLITIHDGDHRLARPEDIEKLIGEIEALE